MGSRGHYYRGAQSKKMVEALPSEGDPSKLLVKQLSRTFALTIPQLPRGLQEPVGVAYLLCRAVDTIEDSSVADPSAKAPQFQSFLDAVDDHSVAQDVAERLVADLSGRITPEELVLIERLPELLAALNAFPLGQQAAIRECLRKMASGMSTYVGRRNGLADMRELDHYCYVVAGVVGEMLTELFCDHCPKVNEHCGELRRLAPSFGQGLHMTNILKDIWDDHRKGRCWLPRDRFQAMGLDLRNLEVAASSPDFRQVMLELADIALDHLENAVEYAVLIPRHQTGVRSFCILAIGMAYATLNRVVRVPQFSPNCHFKINRATVRNLMLASPILSRSNNLTRLTMRNLARDCYKQTGSVSFMSSEYAESQAR
jgi:farnesyl-diphosphate farnesyltransferase